MSAEPIYLVSHVTDSAEALAEAIRAESVDAVVTSPPYNVGTRYAGGDTDAISRAAYLDWTSRWLREVHRILTADGHLFLNVGGIPTDPWVPFEVAARAREAGFFLQNHVTWVKSIAIAGVTQGHYKPVNSPRFLNNTHEMILHLTKTGDLPLARTAEGVGVSYADPSNRRRWEKAKEDGLHCAGSCWFIPYDTRQKEAAHPAAFPLELPLRCLRLIGTDVARDRIPRVLDPFCGSGTTLCAAVCLGWSAWGMDCSEEYTQATFDAICRVLPIEGWERSRLVHDSEGAERSRCVLVKNSVPLSQQVIDDRRSDNEPRGGGAE